MAFLDGRDASGNPLPDPGVGGAIAVSGYAYLGTAVGQGNQVYEFTDAGTWEAFGAGASLAMDDGTTGSHAKEGKTDAPWWTWNAGEGGTVYAVLPPAAEEKVDGACKLLLMEATGGSGAFERVRMIQRANTRGGAKPTRTDAAPGDREHVEYVADYHFYGDLPEDTQDELEPDQMA
jgi:hypothetical protein